VSFDSKSAPSRKGQLQATRKALELQLSMAWRLLEFHLDGLSDEECLWLPATRGPHVQEVSGVWSADWPESETYDIGPASIAWITWHIVFWWSMVLNHSFGDGTLEREGVSWPGSVAALRQRLTWLHEQWSASFGALSDEQLASGDLTRWPFTDKPFFQVGAWLNMELMKNAAEVGYCRFLYASRDRGAVPG
jgi:hypothetical protein